LTDVRVDAAGDWHIALPDDTRPEQLYVDEAWAPVARWPLPDAEVPMLPLAGFDHDAGSHGQQGNAQRAVLTLHHDVSAKLPSTGFQVSVMKDWALFRQRVGSVNGTEIHLTNPTWLRVPRDEWQHNHMTAAMSHHSFSMLV
jgi:hypothetical protein